MIDLCRNDSVISGRRVFKTDVLIGVLSGLIAATLSAPLFSHAAEVLCGDPPKEWREYLKLEQNYNVPNRAVLTSEEIKTQRVYVFEVTSGDGVIHSRAMQNPAVPEKVSVYVAESWVKNDIDSIAKYMGQPARVLCGQRVQGRSTVFAWDPEGKERPFFTKQAADAQSVTELFEKSLKQSGVEGIRFLPEVETTAFWRKYSALGKILALKKEAFVAGSTRRELVPSPGGFKHNREIVPLHGLFGSSKLDEIVEKQGISRDEWIRTRYLPKLADYFAKMHFKLGFYSESHTQNLLVEVDRASGAIESFVVRDFSGLVPDYMKLIVEKRLPVLGIPSGVGLNFGIDDSDMKSMTSYEASQPGANFGSYASQSVVAMEKDPIRRMELGETFLKEYIRQAETITGKPLSLSEKSQEALKWFERKSPKSSSFSSDFIRKQGILGAAFSEVMQDIHEQVAKELAVKMVINESTAAQNAIKKAYDASIKKGYYRVFSSTTEADLERSGQAQNRKYAYDGERIYVLDQDNRVVAATLGLDEKQQEILNRLRVQISFDDACPLRFSRLTRKK